MYGIIAHDLETKTRTKDVILEENVNFNSLLLPNNILKGLTECGFRKPSPIQFKAIPLGRCGFDLIVKSKSGTGKTLVFSTIALEAVSSARNQVQVLILVPTREIAVQIQDVLRSIGGFIEGLNVESFIGGLPVEDDVKKAKQCHIAVGAPGRVKHLISIGALSTEFVKLFVLDEADKLMENSFQNDINEIYNTLPERKQLIASSATYPKELDSFLSNYMLSPTHVSSENETPVLLGLKQFISIIKTSSPNIVQVMKSKNQTLVDIFSKVSFTQCLVFSNYQMRAESISNYLNQNGWNSFFISAAQSQTKRLEAVNNLKEFKNRILLSTDLTSRGIDAPNVDLVINYDIPQDAVTYLHRMGRAGRYGSSGICINLASNGDELKLFQSILGAIGTSNLSVSVLPPLNEKSYDLWHIDPNILEQIYGISSDNLKDLNQKLKSEIMALKHVKRSSNNQGGKKKNNKKTDKIIKLEELGDVNCVNDMLNTIKKQAEEIDQNLPTDVNTLLQSLAAGDGELAVEDDTRRRKMETPACGDAEISNEDNNKKRKITSTNTLHECNENDVKSDIKKGIFCKNKALLAVTKFLVDPSLQVDAELVSSVEEYLTIMKKEDMEDPGNIKVEEIFSDTKPKMESLEISQTLMKTDGEEIMQNIFKVAYNSILGKNGNSWMDYLPEEEIQHFEEFLRREEMSVSSESDDIGEEEEEKEYYEEDYEENYQMEYHTEEITNDNEQDRDIALQWVPVVQSENSNDAQIDHFNKCYDDCSNVLWQNGLSFETVEAFDNWFYEWQQQLQSVSNYVQQNIYVAEMNKYQHNRFGNKE